ncbi:MAG: shikimate dehydrogenase [Oscillospiraceae bacterium]|nr:shikimate dehydrogenase [Oscillospiraceae bacterium]
MNNYGLLGFPLGHTMSPPIHKRLFELEGVNDFDYTLFEIPEEELDARKNELLSLKGFNITIPHKGNIMRYLDELDDSAKRYSSVNCVVERDGRHIGYNTDCDGFLRSVSAAGGSLSGDVLLCGCGGVGRMIAIECVRHGAKLTVSVMKGFEDTVEPVREYARANGIDTVINTVYPNTIERKHYDTLINATPVGMFPKVDACPVSADIIKDTGFVFDVIYNPEETLLMKTARENGITAVGGMAMLVYQAVVAHEIWSGASYRTEDIDRLISDMHALMRS